MDHEIEPIGELKPNDLKEIAGMVGPDSEDLSRVGVGLRPTTATPWSRAWRMAASGIPCLRADRWISTSAIS